jgi:hypothetical protein
MALSGTHKLAGVAIGCAGGALALEIHALVKGNDDEVTPAEVAREAVEVAVAGYRAAPVREAATFNLLVSYLGGALAARGSTWLIRHRGGLGPVLRNRSVAGRHIHHFLPGIALAFLAGGASIVSRNEELDKILAVPFGVGAALTLDEAALLIELEDVYWSEEGILSVQVSLGVTAALGAMVVGRRLLRRGGEEGTGPALGGEDGLVTAGPDADEGERHADEI